MLRPGARVRIRTKKGLTLEGLVLPRYELYSKEHITLKLDNGYNVGVKLEDIVEVNPIESRPSVGSAYGEVIAELPKVAKELPEVLVVGTGGTIASRIDYETGGVKPTLSAEELMRALPELAEIARLETISLFNILSENMEPRLWSELAERILDELEKGDAAGIVVTHGTDTMAYTAAALSFALRRLPAPIALVGAQRSSDRPSSDAALNMLSAVLYALSDFGEVAVVMHGEIGDTYALAHRGVRVRKMHASRRDAFQSIGSRPLAKIFPLEKRVMPLRSDYARRAPRGLLEARTRFEEKVALVKYYPGMSSELLDFLVDRGYRGVVIEGTGMGHVAERLVPSVRRAVEQGTVVVVATQCIFGSVDLYVYSTGRKLLEAGAMPAGNMLAETAYVKLSWLLGNLNDEREVVALFRENLVGEYEPRELTSYFPRWDHG
ncbi:MAG: Glu-tRNA(Gln) amidotransferase subunit GatD [Fervidicoccaceae archaeon]